MLKDAEIIAEALNQWANVLQTGNRHYSLSQVISMGRTTRGLPTVTDEQQKFIYRLWELANEYQEKANAERLHESTHTGGAGRPANNT